MARGSGRAGSARGPRRAGLAHLALSPRPGPAAAPAAHGGRRRRPRAAPRPFPLPGPPSGAGPRPHWLPPERKGRPFPAVWHVGLPAPNCEGAGAGGLARRRGQRAPPLGRSAVRRRPGPSAFPICVSRPGSTWRGRCRNFVGLAAESRLLRPPRWRAPPTQLHLCCWGTKARGRPAGKREH